MRDFVYVVFVNLASVMYIHFLCIDCFAIAHLKLNCYSYSPCRQHPSEFAPRLVIFAYVVDANAYVVDANIAYAAPYPMKSS